jgi:hypothetical protein
LLDDANHQQQVVQMFFLLVDGHRPDAPTTVGMGYEEARPATANATDKGWAGQDWSRQPRPDATLEGVKTVTLTNRWGIKPTVFECGCWR